MKADPTHIEERIRAFQEACRRAGAKATHQRTEIFRAVIATDTHPDAQNVYRQVPERIPASSLHTEYGHLKLLAEKGFLQIAGTSHDSLRFDGNMAHHHHFSCTRCGMIRDFVTDDPQGLKIPEEACAFGEVQSLHLEVKGICAACRKKLKAKDKK